MGGLLTVFTLYLSVAGAVAGSVDAAAVQTLRRAIAAAVPVVGGVLSGAAETLLWGAAGLKNSIGLLGVLAVLSVCAAPVVRIAVQYLLYKLCALVTAAAAGAPLVKLLNGLGDAFALVLASLGSCAMLLLVSLLSSLRVVLP